MSRGDASESRGVVVLNRKRVERDKKKTTSPVMTRSFLRSIVFRRLCLGFGATFFGPIGVEEVAAFFVGAFVGVCTEVVTLTLEQVGG